MYLSILNLPVGCKMESQIFILFTYLCIQPRFLSTSSDLLMSQLGLQPSPTAPLGAFHQSSSLGNDLDNERPPCVRKCQEITSAGRKESSALGRAGVRRSLARGQIFFRYRAGEPEQ